MSLLTIEEARDQCRLEDDYPEEQLQPYVDAAEAIACAYLNRAVFVDANALASAQDAIPGVMTTAGQVYTAAVTVANALSDPDEKAAALEVAEARICAARLNARRTAHGMAANAAVMAAVRLLLGHLFANREDVLTGARAAAVAIPNGAQDLLRPYRMVMMP